MDLVKIRRGINKTDLEILKLVKQRLKLAKKAISYKNKNNLSLRNKKREKEVIKEMIIYGEKLGINSKFSKKLAKLLIKEAIKTEKQELKN